MKIAITGSGGFVGSYLVEYFSKNNQIIAFNRKREETKKNINFIKWDLKYKYNNVIDCDVFIHSATNTGYENTKDEMIENNVLSNKNILDKLNESKCRHFIYISSSSVYQGLSGVINSNTEIDENNLENSYSLTKYLAENFIRDNLNKNIKLTILRPRAIYGEGDRVLVPNILKNKIFGRLVLPGNGKNKTSVTEINYFIEKIDDVIVNKKYGIYNISSKIDSYENLYKNIVNDYKLKGIIKIPIFIFKLLYIFNKNKYSYIIDTFGNDKLLK